METPDTAKGWPKAVEPVLDPSFISRFMNNKTFDSYFFVNHARLGLDWEQPELRSPGTKVVGISTGNRGQENGPAYRLYEIVTMVRRTVDRSRVDECARAAGRADAAIGAPRADSMMAREHAVSDRGG